MSEAGEGNVRIVKRTPSPSARGERHGSAN